MRAAGTQALSILLYDATYLHRLAKTVLYGQDGEEGDLGEGAGMKASGLDLIFRKLDELEKKVRIKRLRPVDPLRPVLDTCPR